MNYKKQSNKSYGEISLKEFMEKKPKSLSLNGNLTYDKLAAITHYIHNIDSPAGTKYKNDAISNMQALIGEKYPDSKELKGLLTEAPEKYFLHSDIIDVPYPTTKKPKFTFIDLFAGMGGFRIAMQKSGGKCIFSSEWNAYAQKTYFANFGDIPFGDITLDETKEFIPDNFDVLCAGFPCQPFSIAGISKKNSLGRTHGFLDKTQGTLFFDVADIINKKRPKIFFLENVKNLVSHDKGNTFKIIFDTLTELGYNVHYKVIDAKGYVPQHRERIMIVGFNNDVFNKKEDFTFPDSPENKKEIREILDLNVDPKYTLSDKLWTYLQDYARKHKAKGNGFGFGLVDLKDISRTLSARYYKDGAEILIPQGDNKNPRRLTPRECARLMGYEDKYILDRVSEVQAYRQCGNSVVVPLISAVSERIVETLLK